MKQAKILRIYLDEGTMIAARKGRMNFLNQIKEAMEGFGYRVEFRKDTDSERLKSAQRNGYSLFHMEDPFHNRALTFRRVYIYPFWQIESTAKRWEWEAATTKFDPATIKPEQGKWFANYWRNQIFDGEVETTQGGYVFIPLQGRLLQQRSFQAATPIEMIKITLDQCAGRKVIASLHPNEYYSEEEKEALVRLSERNSRFSFVSGGSDELLKNCDYVVTQNSSMAFHGYFLHKPAVLFGQIDFHHIAAKTWEHGFEGAFQAVEEMQPEYDRYLFWFLHEMSINAGKNTVQQKIIDAFRRGGWVM